MRSIHVVVSILYTFRSCKHMINNTIYYLGTNICVKMTKICRDVKHQIQESGSIRKD